MHQRESNVMMSWGAVLAIVFTVSLGAIAASPATAQQLVPFRIGSQTPPIFEYVYINYAIEGGFLETGDRRKVRRVHRRADDDASHGRRQPRCGMRWFHRHRQRHRAGSPAKTVYSVNADNTYVIVTRDTISKVDDLRGKKWAITQMGAISQTYAALWLSKNGLPDGPVDWIPIGGTSARARAVHRQPGRRDAADGRGMVPHPRAEGRPSAGHGFGQRSAAATESLRRRRN